MNNLYEKFTNLYPVSKTLRFELKPQGNTLWHMKENGIMENDMNKNEAYKIIKKLMDDYHKVFISKCLNDFKIDTNDLYEYSELIKNKVKNKKAIESIKADMRKSISNVFTKNAEYKMLFGKEMITKILPKYYEADATNIETINEFSKFTTYFSGFFENRKNMYVAEEKSTAIAYRIVNENLPIFVSNMYSYEKVKSKLGKEILDKIYVDLSEIFQVENIDEMFHIEYFNSTLTQQGIDVYNNIIDGYPKKDGTKIKGINEYINEYKQAHSDDKSIKKLNVLYKQILSDTQTASFIIDNFIQDNQLLEALRKLSDIMNNEVLNNNELRNLLQSIRTFDLSRIYIKNNLSLREISNKLYSDWSLISRALRK